MTAEHDGADPGEGTLAHFGQEARREREKLGWSHARFGKEASCGYSQVARVERGERVPSKDYAKACDRVFPGADGRFLRLWPLALRFAYPPWFRKYVNLEVEATRINLFNSVVLPGLVQTEEYARAVLSMGRTTDLDEVVTARVARQRILERSAPPSLWITVDERVLRTSPGDPGVLWNQLEHLRRLAETPPHTVQIVPENRYQFRTPFSTLSFSDGADVAHVDGYPIGYLVAEDDRVTEAQRSYDLLRAAALPPEDSAALIDQLLKEYS